MNTIELITKIESYRFQNEAGYLKNCEDWHKLKREVKRMHKIIQPEKERVIEILKDYVESNVNDFMSYDALAEKIMDSKLR